MEGSVPELGYGYKYQRSSFSEQKPITRSTPKRVVQQTTFFRAGRGHEEEAPPRKDRASARPARPLHSWALRNPRNKRTRASPLTSPMPSMAAATA